MTQIQKEQFLEILQKYHEGTASKEEEEFLEAYYQAFGLRADYTESLSEEKRLLLKDNLKKSVIADIYAREQGKLKTTRMTIARWSATAAAIMIAAGVSLVYYSHKENIEVRQIVSRVVKKDISPGGNKAVLTLANGKKISLTDAGNGLLAEEQGMQITKSGDGQLIYTTLAGIKLHGDGKLLYNSIETPNGGQYQVSLPDGSKVWLNAGSKITYPSTFSAGPERRVELSGEAYFEVVKDKKQPFIVKTINQEIEVLGTQFNINSYEDESAVKTTLLEGSVKVKGTNGMNEILKPGHQSVMTAGEMKVNKIDPELAVAWKNNLFIFESDDIRYIMRLISRWYDVKVEYRGAVPDDKFGGSVSRFQNVSEVLETLEATGKVNFSIEGDRIIVSK